MVDSLRVTCSCGCENRVPVERQGQSVICTICGNPLLAEGQAPSDSTPTARPEVLGETSEPAAMHKRSPFEADPEQELSALDRVEAIRQTENRARRIFIDGLSQRDGLTDETCSQCGRELRGEWDRMETAAGVLCYLCSNQATDGLPERLKTQYLANSGVRRRNLQRSGTDLVLPPSWRNSRWRDLQTLAFKGAAVILVCMVFSMAVYYTFFDTGSPAEATAADSAPAILSPNDLRDLPTGMWVVARGWMIVSVILPVFVTLYLVLLLNGSFPNKGFLGNIGFVAWTCSPVLAIQLAGVLGETILWGRPSLALVVSFTLGLLHLMALLFIFFEMLEDSFWQCVSFVLFLLILSRFAVPYLNLVMFRSLGIL
jgi:hypothetical protein